MDEVFRRSNSIFAANSLTQEWLVSFFGCPVQKIVCFADDTYDSIQRTLQLFWGKQKCSVDIDVQDIYDFYNKQLGRMQNSLFCNTYEKDIIISEPQTSFIGDKVIDILLINIGGDYEKFSFFHNSI